MFIFLISVISALQTPTLQILYDDIPFGYIYVAPISNNSSEYHNGVAVFDTAGNIKNFIEIPKPEFASDFRLQWFLNQQILTYWQGKTLDNGRTCGHGIIANFGIEIYAANRRCVDSHEFLITADNTAYIITYEIETVDLSSYGGSKHQKVVFPIIQEIDPFTRELLFEWRVGENVPFSETYAEFPTDPEIPWDWFHCNAVRLDTDNNLLVSGRYTWTIYKVNRQNGDIMWCLGGKNSSFQSADTLFRWQHSPSALGNNQYLILDNEDVNTPSRALRIYLDGNFASILEIYRNDKHVKFQGNVHQLQDVTFVNWGNTREITAFNENGNLSYHAKFPEGVYSNRAYYFRF